MSTRRRLLNNTLSNFASLGLNALMQFLQVAVLSACWSLEKYGIWIMLSTIPSYLALSDLGFLAAAQSDMTMSYSRHDFTKVQSIYQSITAMFGLFLFVCVLLASPLAALPLWGGDVPVFLKDYGTLIFLFIVYACLALCSRTVLAGYRSTGFYALGSFIYEISVTLEGLAILGAAISGGSFFTCVLSGMGMRLCSSFALYFHLKHLNPFMRLGFSHVSYSEIKRLFKPALAAMAIPLSMTINIQGLVFVAGIILSPAAAAVLTPVRTASRVIVQLVGTFNRGAMPEISRTASSGDKASLSRLLKASRLSQYFILLPATALFALGGKSAVELWTHGHIVPSYVFVALMATAAFFNGSWNFLSNILLATNDHIGISRNLSISSLLTVVIAIPMGHFLGLEGIGAASALGEMLCLASVYYFYRQKSPHGKRSKRNV